MSSIGKVMAKLPKCRGSAELSIERRTLENLGPGVSNTAIGLAANSGVEYEETIGGVPVTAGETFYYPMPDDGIPQSGAWHVSPGEWQR